jgi:hypothetical protein
MILQAVSVNIPLDLATKFKDPEGNNPTCRIVNSRYSTYFTTSGNNLRLAKKLDYDTYTPPHHFYICKYRKLFLLQTNAADLPPIYHKLPTDGFQVAVLH